MEQIYTPNINVSARTGFCLQYIDDAGNAPKRTATADYSWQIEKNAGRIQTSTIPEKVWLVGWLKFTTGMYQAFGHVFFIRRVGNSYEIHDSEVHSGQRKPYKSLQELLAWFGAYKPTYTGWSTHCDGREYAKQGGEEMGARLQSNNDVDNLYLAVLHHYPENDAIRKNWIGKTWDEALSALRTSGEYLAQNAVVNGEYQKALAKIKELEQSKGGDAQRKLDQIKEALK